MSAPGKSLEERLHFVKHKGHAIYVIDFSHCAEKEMLLLLDMVRVISRGMRLGRCSRCRTSPVRMSIRMWLHASKKFWCSIART